jgi:MFS transporter, LPLT family, lysophospholipid transporter
MPKQTYLLLVAQFLSSFADNAILFTVIAMVMQATQKAAWYIPALQSAFLVAYVVLAPWVGHAADYYPKARVLVVANLIKAAGAILLLLHMEPLLAYGLVGVGAALYSPAKYGILPELVGHHVLVKANGWIEGSTILAILLGMVVGAKVADYSVAWALGGTTGLFLLSAVVAMYLPVQKRQLAFSSQPQWLAFGHNMQHFFVAPRPRFAILGGSLFWATAATLRMILIAWAPAVLMLKNASDIAQLTLFLALGIIVGSAVVPKLIPLEQLHRTRFAAYAMGALILLLALTNSLWPARCVLFVIGMMGGLFIVPINAVLQELGQKSIGSGSAVSLQNFFQNLAMLVAVGGYTLAASLAVMPIAAMLALGGLLLLATFVITLRLPNSTG